MEENNTEQDYLFAPQGLVFFSNRAILDAIEDCKIKIKIAGKPKAIQSVRVAQRGKFIQKYQPSANIEWKNWIRLNVQQQLPADFKIFENVPLAVRVIYCFAPPKSFSKKKQKDIEEGICYYKTTRPDVNDNLNKGVFDALTDLVWRDDSLVVKIQAEKLFCKWEGIYIEIYQLGEFCCCDKLQSMLL